MKLLIFFALFLAYGHAEKTPIGYIIKGHDAVPHAAPYIVSISYNGNKRHNCGGTIIAKDWILTAAHCILPNAKIFIAAGVHAHSDLNYRVQIRQVDFVKGHENYEGGPTPNDIALFHLSEPLKYNQYVQPAILPAAGEIHSGSVHLYGWGLYDPNVYKTANILQTVETKIVNFNDCKQDFPSVVESNLCSDSLQRQIAACSADSGGPLVIERDGVSSEVVGVVSWGASPCGINNKPSVYVRVSAYIEWILKVQFTYNVMH